MEGPGAKVVLEGIFSYPDNTTEATKYFLVARKYNIKIASIQKYEDISTRFHNIIKLWNLRKEKQALTVNIYDTIKL